MSKELKGKYPDDLYDISAIPAGTKLRDYFNNGVRVVVMRAASSLCVYVGVPETHPLAGKDYEKIPLDCHGGLTYSGSGNDKYLPMSFYWYGWDYNHSGDCGWYKSGVDESGKKWTIKEVLNDSWSAIYNFESLMKLAEEVADE